MNPRLTVRTLGVAYGEHTVLHDVDLDVAPGATTAVVGPSGAGKSSIGLAVMGLLPRDARLLPGTRILLDGTAMPAPASPEWPRWRGARVAMVFQDPLAALNPVLPVGAQIAEAARLHGERSARQAHQRAVTMLARLRVDDPERRARQYPHQLSGGMRQRAMLAMALINRPALLVADEPTTALDATVQAQVLALLREIQREDGLSVLLISHDPGVVAAYADSTVHLGDPSPPAPAPPPALTPAPAPAPARAEDAPTPPPTPLVEIRNLVKLFPAGPAPLGREGPAVRAVNGVSLDIMRGETLAIVGESGCGKSTLAHAVLRLTDATAGEIRFDGIDLRALAPTPLRRMRRRMQLVFQDASGALDPRLTVRQAVAEGLEVHGLARGDAAARRVRDLLHEVGLAEPLADRHPAELSGGERQRVALARALATDPDLLVMDEAVSSLDARARDAALALLERLQRERGLTYLFITHDLGVVTRLATRVAVMYLGRIVELLPRAAFRDGPAHPYTQALLAAVPLADGTPPRIILAGDVPSAAAPPPGCVFHTRCPHPARDAECARRVPPLVPLGPAHAVACLKSAPSADSPSPRAP